MTDSLDSLAASARRQFSSQFGRAPTFIAVAPGRVNLIGGHVDYNEGIVMPVAIDRYVVIAGDANPTNQANVFSETATPQEIEVSLDDLKHADQPSWVDYLRGVLAGFQQRGWSVPGFDAVVCSNVPTGAGLSSSAALEVCFATFLEGLIGESLDKKDKALLCQKAEHDFVGVPCGVMDQLASTLSRADHLMKLDCLSLDTHFVPWPSDEISLLIIDSQTPRHLADGEYTTRRKQCQTALERMKLASYRHATIDDLSQHRSSMSELEYRRGRHVLSEMERCRVFGSAIAKQDWHLAGVQLFSSHDSLRDDFQVSCPELDLLVDLAKGIGTQGGVYGMRMTGAGFGGCTVAMVNPGDAAKITNQICEKFESEFFTSPPCNHIAARCWCVFN